MMPDELAPLGYLGGVNRSAITITPKEPYLAWTRAVSAHEADPPTYISTRSATLLIPELDEAEASTYLRENSGAVFREMLTRWCRDQSKWPQGVDEWTTFTAWFEIRYALDVFDRFLKHDGRGVAS